MMRQQGLYTDRCLLSQKPIYRYLLFHVAVPAPLGFSTNRTTGPVGDAERSVDLSKGNHISLLFLVSHRPSQRGEK